MKKHALALVVWFAFAFACAAQTSSALAAQKSVCPQESNAEMRQCFALQQLKVSEEVDRRTAQIAASFRSMAADADKDGRHEDAQKLRSVAVLMLQAHTSWKKYREQYCRAVELSWSSGSGAPTAHQQCLFEVGRQRLNELSSELLPSDYPEIQRDHR